MTYIWPGLFLGNIYDARQLEWPNPQNICAVVILNGEKLPCPCSQLKYFDVPILDDVDISRNSFDMVMAAIGTGVRRGNTLVCCSAGISRGPSLIAAYLQQKGWFSFDEAIAHIRKLRPSIDPSPVLVASVKQHCSNEWK